MSLASEIIRKKRKLSEKLAYTCQVISKSLDLVEAKTKVIVNALEVRLGKLGTAEETEVQGQVAKSCESMRGLNAQCDKVKA